MNTLVVALIVPILAAAVGGSLLGAAVAHAKQEYKADDYPILDAVTRRRNPLVNAAFAVAFWSALLYVIPRASFAVFGVDDSLAYFISGAIQVTVLSAAFLLAERLWSRRY